MFYDSLHSFEGLKKILNGFSHRFSGSEFFPGKCALHSNPFPSKIKRKCKIHSVWFCVLTHTISVQNFSVLLLKRREGFRVCAMDLICRGDTANWRLGAFFDANMKIQASVDRVLPRNFVRSFLDYATTAHFEKTKKWSQCRVSGVPEWRLLRKETRISLNPRTTVQDSRNKKTSSIETCVMIHTTFLQSFRV